MSDLISVIIVTDHKLLSDCLVSILTTSDQITVPAVTQDQMDTLEQVEKHQPDVVLIDVQLPSSVTISLTKHLTHNAPEVHILLLGAIEPQTSLLEYVEAGAVGYVLKSSSPFTTGQIL